MVICVEDVQHNGGCVGLFWDPEVLRWIKSSQILWMDKERLFLQGQCKTDLLKLTGHTWSHGILGREIPLLLFAFKRLGLFNGASYVPL